jgi:hypothetical protein
MIHNLRFDTASDLLPPFELPIYQCHLNPITTIMMEKVIRDLEPVILAIDAPDNLRANNWMTARLGYYNLLDYDFDQIRRLETFILESYKGFVKELQIPERKIYAHAWVNIVRRGEKITMHNHADAHAKVPDIHSYMSGNLCITAENTGTGFKSPYNSQSHIIRNVPGECFLFPSFINHYTTENQSDNPRYTIAFDIITEEVYNQSTNQQLFKSL